MNFSAIRQLLLVVALMTPAAIVQAQPGAPAGLTATGAPARVDLHWSAVPGATGYRVSRGTASGTYGYFVDLGTATSYADMAVTNATQYFYVVAAKNALGIGANSAPTKAAPGSYTGAPFLIAPAHESRPLLGMSFEWSDPAVYSSYSFVLVDIATGLVVYSASLSATSGPCSSGTTCVLAPGMAGYPPPLVLDTRDFKWTVLGNGTWALGGAGNYNHIHPILRDVASLTAKWTGKTISLAWPASSGAAGYHATFMNWAFVTSSEMYAPAAACVGAACSGTADVRQIPFGTVHVRLEVCGANGVCSAGVTADALKACPATMPAPSLVTPAHGSTVNGLTTLRWVGSTTAERYDIQINRNKNAGASTVKNEVLWHSQVTCGKNADGLSCSRTYGLNDGAYTAVLRSSCGGAWGPQTTAAFIVDSSAAPVAHMSPPIWSPSKNATTSVQPVMVWSRVADIDKYELVVTTTGGTSSTYAVICKTAICTFDYAKEALKLQGRTPSRFASPSRACRSRRRERSPHRRPMHHRRRPRSALTTGRESALSARSLSNTTPMCRCRCRRSRSPGPLAIRSPAHRSLARPVHM